MGDNMILTVLIVLLGIWELIWKGIGLWFSAKNNSKIWFIFILILNTAGILPIIYLFLKTDFFRKKKTRRKRK
jgi:hypothetical protein